MFSGPGGRQPEAEPVLQGGADLRSGSAPRLWIERIAEGGEAVPAAGFRRARARLSSA
jgi:hypothetical protein